MTFLKPKFIPTTKKEFDTLALLMQVTPHRTHPEGFMKLDEIAYAITDEKKNNIMLKVVDYQWGPSMDGVQMSERQIKGTRYFNVEYE